MPLSARPDRTLALALAAALLLAPVARAGEPIALSDTAGIERLAAVVERYAGASRVRWTIRASPAESRRILGALAARLGPAGADLLGRVGTTAPQASLRSLSADSASLSIASAVMAVEPGPAMRCSWQVTVTDPAAPTGTRSALPIPLEPGDRLPVSGDASVEIAASGPLQYRHYAFGETAPGTIRDLAAAPEIAIPVADTTEQLVLVRTRQPVPFLDGLRTALAAAPGAARPLGRDVALVDRFRNIGRGIGANIQLLDPAMIQAETPASRMDPSPGPAAPMGDLAETCLYTLLR